MNFAEFSDSFWIKLFASMCLKRMRRLTSSIHFFLKILHFICSWFRKWRLRSFSCKIAAGKISSKKNLPLFWCRDHHWPMTCSDSNSTIHMHSGNQLNCLYMRFLLTKKQNECKMDPIVCPVQVCMYTSQLHWILSILTQFILIIW